MNETMNTQQATKYCKHCGQLINEKAVICPQCGCQVEEIAPNQQPSVVINNSNSNVNSNVNQNINAGAMGKPKNKRVALVLCACLGLLGAHKFYEGKAGMGILYIFTGGLFLIGIIVDFIALLGKPNPYYVY